MNRRSFLSLLADMRTMVFETEAVNDGSRHWFAASLLAPIFRHPIRFAGFVSGILIVAWWSGYDVRR